MKSLLLAAVALGLVALPFAGCDDSMSCTDAGCGSTLDVLIEVEGGGPLPVSTYEIVLELDGTPYSTVCGLAEPGFTCEPVEGPDGFRIDAEVTTNASTIVLSVLADEGEGDGPQSVHLTVVAGDAPLVDTTVEPKYEIVFPNGEECAPRCVQADPITATFAPPTD